MTIPDRPPRGLRWVEQWPSKALVILLAVISLSLSIYVAGQYVTFVDCLRRNDRADQQRTAAIATATDAERKQQALLLAATTPAAAHEAKRAVIRAYAETDRVRAANPPDTRSCG